MVAGTSGNEVGVGLDTCAWTESGGVWIRNEFRDKKTAGEGTGDDGTTLTSSSKLIRGVRGIVSLRGLMGSHSEREGVEGAEESVGESG
jgi:hypothetical protein